MRIKVYRATEATDLPAALFAELDGHDDRYLAAFQNYPDSIKFVVVAWATTGEVKGEVISTLIATACHIITGFIDTYFDTEILEDGRTDENDDCSPVDHDEPNSTKRLAALLARLRAISPTDWLLVHDADEVDNWIEQGFVVVDPPAAIPADEAVQVLAWGTLPEDAQALLHARGLSWRRATHRGFTPKDS